MKLTYAVKRFLIAGAVVFVMLMTSACGMLNINGGPSVFRAETDSKTQIKVFAENAPAGETITAGQLKVAEGDGMRITSDLDRGNIKISVYEMEENHLTEEQYAATDTPIISANLRMDDCVSATLMPEGEYLVKAECTEKASGEIGIKLMKQ